MCTLSNLAYPLKFGSLYKSFKEYLSDDEVLPIPEKYVTNDFTIYNKDVFLNIINICDYWGLYKLPVEVYVYALFYREEVLSVINELDPIRMKAYKDDFTYNIGIIKYKNEIIDYVKNEFIYEDIKELQQTQNYEISLKCEKVVTEQYLINSNQYTTLNITSLVYELSISNDNRNIITKTFETCDTYTRNIIYQKSNNIVDGLVNENSLLGLNKLINSIKSDTPINLGDMAFKNNELLTDYNSFYITKFNKDKIIRDLTSIFSQVCSSLEEITSFKIYQSDSNLYIVNPSAVMSTSLFLNLSRNDALLNQLQEISYDSIKNLLF
jgi:hypothetical protein